MANLHSPKLSAAFVKAAKPGKYTDGHGLMLWVKPTGTRSWVQRLIIQGKRRDMGLGRFHWLRSRKRAKLPSRTGRSPGPAVIPGTNPLIPPL